MLKFYPTTRSFFSNTPSNVFDTFESFFAPEKLNSKHHKMTQTPRANIYKYDHGYSVQLAAPGFSRENFETSVEDNMLTITAKNEVKTDNANIHYQEWQYNEFKRSWALPDNVNMEGITARYEAGILHVEVPTMDKKSSRKLISVE